MNKYFGNIFREKSWEGVIGRKPTETEYRNALTNFDLFM